MRLFASLILCSAFLSVAASEARAQGSPGGNPFAGTWTPTAPLPAPRFSAAVATCGSQVFLMGGVTNALPRTRSVLAYDSRTDSWTSLPDYPGPPIRSATAIGLEGFVYLFGGYLYDYAISDEVWRFDPATGVWEPRTPMPEARLHASVHELNGRIYVLGGRTTPAWTYRSTALLYDPGLDTHPPSAQAWTMQTDAVLSSPLGDNSGAAIEGDLFTLGSYEPSVPSRFLVYSPRFDRWRQLPPTPFTVGPAAVRVRRTLFALQGDGQMWSWEYSPWAGSFRKLHQLGVGGSQDIGSFVSEPTRPEVMHGAAITELDGRIYCFGGLNGPVTDHGWVFEQ